MRVREHAPAAVRDRPGDLIAIDVRSLTLGDVTPLLEAMRKDGLAIEPLDGDWFGAVRGEEIVGVARTIPAGSLWLLDDVWVRADERSRGLAASLIDAAKRMHSTLWLICDEDMIGFYSARGFAVVDRPAVPADLSAYYVPKGEWPRASDHEHFAMRWPA